MTPHALSALLISYVLVGAIAWGLCRRRCIRQLAEIRRKHQEIEAECWRTATKLREVHEQFGVFERALIHVQLLMEQAQERDTPHPTR